MPRIDFYAAIAIPSVGVFAYGDELTCGPRFLKLDTINIEVAMPILLIRIVSRDGVNAPYILDLGNLFVGYHCRLNKLFPLGVMMGSSLSKLALSTGVRRGSYGRDGCWLAEEGGMNLYWSAG